MADVYVLTMNHRIRKLVDLHDVYAVRRVLNISETVHITRNGHTAYGMDVLRDGDCLTLSEQFPDLRSFRVKPKDLMAVTLGLVASTTDVTQLNRLREAIENRLVELDKPN